MDVRTRLMFVIVIVTMVPVASLSTIYAYFAKSDHDAMTVIASDLNQDRVIARKMHDTLVEMDVKLHMLADSNSNAERTQLLRDVATLRGIFVENVALVSGDAHTPGEEAAEDRIFPLIDGLTHNQIEAKMASDIAMHFEPYIASIDVIPSIPFNEDFKPMVTAILASQNEHLNALHVSIGDYEDLQQLTLEAIAEESAVRYQLYFLYGTLASGFASASAIATSIIISKVWITIEEKRVSKRVMLQ